jgi:3-methyladenine DNA glycosylase AlkC
MITPELESALRRTVIEPVIRGDLSTALRGIREAFDNLYDAIPDRKRISLGRVYVTRTLGQHLYESIKETEPAVLAVSAALLEQGSDHRDRGAALFMIAGRSAERPAQELPDTLPYFEAAARSEDWNLRELSQAFFRLVIKAHRKAAHDILARLAKAPDANLRRFVSESLRPVQENRWFYRNPEYPLSILRMLFREAERYPRTSVGNNLSDLARRLPDLVLSTVGDLVETGDKNSYWIAYRACRNLVKTRPLDVMDLLHVDEYRYKKRIYRRYDSP